MMGKKSKFGIEGESGDGGVNLMRDRYIVQSVSISSLTPIPSSSTSIAKPAQYPKPEPSVLIGIFPSACVHIRAESGDDPTLTIAYERAISNARERDRDKEMEKGKGGWIGVNEMDAVREEDEDGVGSPEKAVKVGEEVVEIHGTGNQDGMSRGNRPSPLVLEGKIQDGEGEGDKEQPPLPSLTAGDSTIAGQQWPLVDEISCAIREWYGVSYSVQRPSLELTCQASTHLSREQRISPIQYRHATYRRAVFRQTSTALSNAKRG
jgi:dedicator of cytokinesis protein 3